MSYDEKTRLFRDGRYLLRMDPPVSHWWTQGDWIAYIDRNGRWLDHPLCEDSL